MTKKNEFKGKLIIPIVGVILLIIISGIYLFSNNEVIDKESDEENTCGEGAIIYKDNGLCWQKSVAPFRAENWQNAMDYCESLVLGKKDDWRLPELEELKLLIVEKVNEVSIDADYFDDTEKIHYWTATEYSAKSGIHWYVHFEKGYQSFSPDYNSKYGIRCIRDKTIF